MVFSGTQTEHDVISTQKVNMDYCSVPETQVLVNKQRNQLQPF